MSAFGTKRTSLVALHMSAIGGKADIVQRPHRTLKSAIACSRLFDFHSCTDPSLYPLRLEIRHRLLAARRVPLIEERRFRFERRDRPEPRASRRCLWVEEYPTDVPVAVEHVVIVVRPFAARAALVGADQSEDGDVVHVEPGDTWANKLKRVIRKRREGAGAQIRSLKRASWRSDNVRYWHKADIRAPEANVRIRGQSGHRDLRPPCPLMTQSGHL